MFPKILATVRLIPKGKVATYGDVAAASGFPGAARQVVWALRGTKAGAKGVPWHRVIGARGRVLLGGPSGLEQRIRLRTEGVLIAGDRIDLDRFAHQFQTASRAAGAKLKSERR